MADCDGSSDCNADIHVHGCFSDDGTCDEPDEHRPAPVSSEETP